MKKSNLIKGVSFLLALAPATIIASCNSSKNPKLPSNFETVSLGSICETKANKGTSEYSIKVSLNRVGPKVNYFTIGVIFEGERFSGEKLKHFVDPLQTKIVDKEGFPIGLSNDGIFNVNHVTDAYITYNLKSEGSDLTLKENEHLATLVCYVDQNENNSQYFDLGVADNGQWKVFSYEANQGTPCVMPTDGLFHIDSNYNPVIFGNTYRLDDKGNLVPSEYFATLKKLTEGDFSYYRAVDEADHEFPLHFPSQLYVLAKIKTEGYDDSIMNFSSIIDVDKNLEFGNLSNLSYKENVYYRTQIQAKEKEDDAYHLFADAYVENITEEYERGLYHCNSVFDSKTGAPIPHPLDVVRCSNQIRSIMIEYVNNHSYDVAIRNVHVGLIDSKSIDSKEAGGDNTFSIEGTAKDKGKSIVYSSKVEDASLFEIKNYSSSSNFDLNKPFSIDVHFDRHGYDSQVSLVSSANLVVTYTNSLIPSMEEVSENILLTYDAFNAIPYIDDDNIPSLYASIDRKGILEFLDTPISGVGQNISISRIQVFNIHILYERDDASLFTPNTKISWSNI